MPAEEGKPEDKIDFNLEGEVPGYIGLDQARIQAIEHARDNTDFYGPKYEGVSFVFEFKDAKETEDYYEINLSFRPAGRWRGEPGLEQFIFDKMGDLRVRQLFDEPMAQAMSETREERATEPQLESVTDLDTEPQLETETELTTKSVETVAPPVTAPTYTIAEPKEPNRGTETGKSIGPVGSTEQRASNVTATQPLRPPQRSAVYQESRDRGGSDLESLREKLEAFEDRLERLSAIDTELKSLDTGEFSQEDHELSGILKAPDMVEEAESRLAALKQAINRGGNHDTSSTG